jgi:hypothetical protein
LLRLKIAGEGIRGGNIFLYTLGTNTGSTSPEAYYPASAVAVYKKMSDVSDRYANCELE